MKQKNTVVRAALLSSVCMVALPMQVQAFAAEAAAKEMSFEEIIVTARKRKETDISVPVSVTVLGASQINKFAIDSFADLASYVPGLTVGQLSNGSGGGISLRGIGTAALGNPSIEQTVTVNVDGVQVRGGNAARLGQFDMAGIEVLRGSQALFFGKNSPAGVISFKSADPSDELELMARVGYELNAEEKVFDAVISGPVSDTLGLRLAASYTDMNGWVKNQAFDVADAANAIVPGAVNALVPDGPEYEAIMMRATALWKPTDTFSVRAKISYSGSEGAGFQQGSNQRINCPYGAPQVSALHFSDITSDPDQIAALTSIVAVDDCTANDVNSHGSINAAHVLNSPFGSDEEGLNKSDFLLASLEANWDVSDTLTVTSVSGYLDIEEGRYDTYSYLPVSGFAGLNFGGPFTFKQLSEEIRLASNFEDSPFDFMVGGYIEDSKLTNLTQQFATPGPAFNQTINGQAQSAFVQAMYDVTETVELSGGVRWTHEKRSLLVNRDGVVQPLDPESLSFNNTSPEITLTWRPTTELTFFGSYREGFKSGGFSAALTGGAAFASPQDFSYRPESVSGFEFGMHAGLLDRQLRINAAIYDYTYKDLQVNSLDASSGIPVIVAGNAAAASLRGAEMDFNWQPSSVDGLGIHGALNYADNTFDEFDATCYIGQTVAEGCTLGLSPTTGRYQAQDLAGEMLPYTSKWSGSFGVSYDSQLADSGWGYFVSLDGTYRSEWNPHPELPEEAKQEDVVYLNTTIRLIAPSEQWEFALVGRNLTEKYRAQIGAQAPVTGSRGLTGSTTTGGHADWTGYVNRGREILFQVTWRPTN